MKKALAALTLTACLLGATASQAELRMEVIFKDTAYGALTGALVGGAAMVFTSKPGDHWMYLAYGGAAGAIAGALYGVYESTTAVAEYDQGTLYLAMPTIRTVREGPRGFTSSADLLRVDF
ncbi:MAG: hypothetical protein HZB55_20255 [Deltaproteobacteria bacterium]|nr:hypothetical protein [Deltaproteobacteria bacterium]